MKKTIIIILMIILMTILAIGQSNAVNITSADLYSKGHYAYLLKYKDMIIDTAYVVYQKDGIEYPAYCLQNNLTGILEYGAYTANVNELISNVMVWRAITNGYPYKNYTELGCQNKEEAYIATKQAVYCMLYNRDGSEYSSMGEEGTRILNALNQIISAARNSSAVKVSSNITI